MKNNTIMMSLLLILTMSATAAHSETASATDFLMSDGTLNIDAIANGGRDLTLNIVGWHIELDPKRGPVFSAEPPLTSPWSGLDMGLSGVVRAMAVSSAGIVYVGGDFRFVGTGGTPVDGLSHIAKWNGSAWSALDMGVHFNSTVRAIAISGTDIYIGGDIGGGLNNVAKWNGTAWVALDQGLAGRVSAIAVSGTDVYVGGSFTEVGAGGVAVTGLNNIAKWNGTAWSALDMGLFNSVSSAVFAIAVNGSNVYVGGSFLAVGTGGTAVSDLNYIAKWNGTAWSALDKGLNNFVNVITANGTDLYIGGGFNNVDQTATSVPGLNYIAKYNTLTLAWSALDKGLNAIVNSITLSGSDIYVGGEFTGVGTGGTAVSGLEHITKWNGTAWSALDMGLNGVIYATAVSGTIVYAGGVLTDVPPPTSVAGLSYIAKYNTPTICPTVSITGLNASYCHGALAFTLSGSPIGGIFTVDGVETTRFDVPLLSVGNHSVVYTYTDGNGCSNSASQTVTINALPTVSLPACKTVYIGYAPAASDILTAYTSSGVLNYIWSNNATTQSITVSPAATTTYTVTATDANGCMAVASTTVESFNVSCTFKLKGKNVIGVSMCQPAVGRTKAKDLCVDPANVPSNLNQGNKLGVCGLVACEPYTSPSPNNALLNGDRQGNSAIVEKKNAVLIYPNPAQDAFTIDFDLDQTTDVTMLLSDINARTLWSKEVKNARQGSETVDINDLPVGVYFVKFLAIGEEAQIHRLVITK